MKSDFGLIDPVLRLIPEQQPPLTELFTGILTKCNPVKGFNF